MYNSEKQRRADALHYQYMHDFKIKYREQSGIMLLVWSLSMIYVKSGCLDAGEHLRAGVRTLLKCDPVSFVDNQW